MQYFDQHITTKVISRYEYNILVIAPVRGGAEVAYNNQDIVRVHPGYNWLLSRNLATGRTTMETHPEALPQRSNLTSQYGHGHHVSKTLGKTSSTRLC